MVFSYKNCVYLFWLRLLFVTFALNHLNKWFPMNEWQRRRWCNVYLLSSFACKYFSANRLISIIIIIEAKWNTKDFALHVRQLRQNEVETMKQSAAKIKCMQMIFNLSSRDVIRRANYAFFFSSRKQKKWIKPC